MAKAKKVLSLVLSAIMLLSCCFVASSALGEGKTLGYKLVADKTTVNPGDVVTYSLYIDTDPSTAYANIALIFSYNSANFVTPTKTSLDRKFYNDFAGYYKDLSAVTVSSTVHNAIKANLTKEEAAAYNASFIIQGSVDTEKGTLADGFCISSADTVQMTFKMTVADTVAPGSTVALAITEGACKTTARCSFKQVTGNEGTTGGLPVDPTNIDLSTATANVTVASAGPAVAKSKAQVKMTPNSATTVEDAFSFRVTSVIADADWDTYFANSADASATTNAIKSVGFVAYKGTTGFNLDTAKAVAQGTPAAGYDVATTDYIQKVNDTSDAFFGCRVDITSAATRSDVTYVAFVQYLDATGNTAYAFYAAEQQALLNTNYDTIVSDYLAAYPFAG